MKRPVAIGSMSAHHPGQDFEIEELATPGLGVDA
jgi:hypothetical protein